MRLQSEFEHANPGYAMMRRIGRGWWNEPKTITTWRETPDGHVELPRGGLQRVRNVLWRDGLDWVLDDQRSTGEGPAGLIPPHKMTLWMHQAEMVAAGLEHQNCILRVPTGGGKTSALFALASEINLATLVVVPTSGLFKQWRDRAQVELGMPKGDVGYIHEGRVDLAPLTIALQPSLVAALRDPERAEKVVPYFGTVLCDEVQFFAADTFFDAVDPFPAKYRIGTSADHRRKDRKEFLVHDLFGAVALDVPRDQLVESGIILDVEMRVLPTSFRADWYGLDKDLDFGSLVKEMAADDARTDVMVDAIVKEAKAGSVCLVCAHHVEHCRRFAQRVQDRGLSVGLLLGGKEESAEFDRTKRRLSNGEIQVAVGTYKATGTGIDIPRVDVVAALTPVAANEQAVNQLRGRACRRGKASARMYYLLDEAVYPRHLSNLTRWCPGALIHQGDEWVPAKKRRR
jgi:superfamily II DNA or RNA helicase